ncbi:Arm DNA-binding domain-containing protein [Stenotrophomonas geniculata]
MEPSKRPELITDKTLRAWLRAGPVDRGIGDGLTFVASARGAAAGKASWVLRFRFGGVAKEKVLGRYPDLSLAQAREKARSDRALIQQGIDVATAKRLAQLDARRAHSAKTAPRPKPAAPNTPLDVQAVDPQRATVCQLGQAWLDRYITPRYKHPDRIRAVLELHLYPTLGTSRARDVVPLDVDRLLVATVARGAPTLANDLLRYLVRLFKYALVLGWATSNPAANFGLRDAGGRERARTRWLPLHEPIGLARAMRTRGRKSAGWVRMRS